MDFGVPDGLSRSTTGLDVEISRRWFTPSILFNIPFTAAWFGFLVYWYIEAFESGDLIGKLVPIFHVAIGFWLIYQTFIGLFNRTRVILKPGFIEVKHGPIPSQKGVKLQSIQIKKIFLREKRLTRRPAAGRSDLMAALVTGENQLLIKGLKNTEQAEYLQQTIKNYHNFKD